MLPMSSLQLRWPQLDRHGALRERRHQPFQIPSRRLLVLEAGRELSQHDAELARVLDWLDRRAEGVDVGGAHHGVGGTGRILKHLRVRELLIELE